jgi:hypothetical protein
MTIRQVVVKWDNYWKYDFWWRQKHNIAFNSAAHREANQADIAFEYIENKLLEEALAEYKVTEEKKKRYDKDGWMSESVVDKEKSIAAFDALDLSKID